RERSAELGRLISESIADQVNEWERIDQVETIDIFQQMLELTLSVIGRSLFGTELQGSKVEFTAALERAIKFIGARISSVVAAPMWLPTPANVEFKKAKRTLRNIVAGIIEQRRKTPSTANDLLHMLMQIKEQGTHAQMNDQQLFDEVITLLISGHETVALGLTWTLYLLCQNPRVESVLLDELKSVLNGRAATVSDLQCLLYTRRVFDKGLSLFPPIWGQPRLALEDDEIQGFAIRKGLHVTVSQ